MRKWRCLSIWWRKKLDWFTYILALLWVATAASVLGGIWSYRDAMDEIIVKVLEIHDFFAKGKCAWFTLTICENNYKLCYLFLAQTIDSWLFMKTPIPMFILFGAYLAFVYVIGPLYMRNRKAFSLNNVTRAYNLCQVAACTIVVTKYLQLGFSFENNLKCSHSDPEDMKLSFLGLWWFITVTRTIELIETAFFILRKKYNQASILHIYHHIGSIFGAWISLKYDASEFD